MSDINRGVGGESAHGRERPSALEVLRANPWLGDGVSPVLVMGVAALVLGPERGANPEVLKRLNDGVLGLLAKKYEGEHGHSPAWYDEPPQIQLGGERPATGVREAPPVDEPLKLRDALLPVALGVGCYLVARFIENRRK